MKKIALASLAAALLLLSCGSGKPGKTPRATFDAVRKAMENRDWGALYDLLDGRELDRAKRQLETDRALFEQNRNELLEELSLSARELDTMTPRDYFIRYTEVRTRARPETVEKIAKSEFADLKVDGEKATITYKAGSETKEMELTRRDGFWYLTRW